MGNYFIGNARVGLAKGRWQGVLNINNLTNEHGNTFAYGNPFSLGSAGQITTPRPRTIGLTLNWSN
jgi:hypothetical protein